MSIRLISLLSRAMHGAGCDKQLHFLVTGGRIARTRVRRRIWLDKATQDKRAARGVPVVNTVHTTQSSQRVALGLGRLLMF